MAWAVRAGTNTLATPDNLGRWGRPVNPKCALPGCSSVCTLGHLLSACSKSLDRFAYRHNSVLAHLLKVINENKGSEIDTYADLNGFRINNGTVPPDLCQTSQKPDLLVLDKRYQPAKIYIIELTCPWDSKQAFQAAVDRKLSRYERLALDLEEKGYTVFSWPFEVGVRGSLDKRNSVLLETICNTFNIKAHKKLKRDLSKIALVASHRIYLARASTDWVGGDFITA